MATHSSTLAWKIPWMEEPGGLQSMGLLGVGHNWSDLAAAAAAAAYLELFFSTEDRFILVIHILLPKLSCKWWIRIMVLQYLATKIKKKRVHPGTKPEPLLFTQVLNYPEKSASNQRSAGNFGRQEALSEKFYVQERKKYTLQFSIFKLMEGCSWQVAQKPLESDRPRCESQVCHLQAEWSQPT